jgi:hypothetical protein
MKAEFEIVGYHREYYNSRKKYIGSERMDTPDRNVMGYQGRYSHNAEERITIGKKSIKAGEVYYTECVPVCGRLKGTFKDKMQVLENSRVVFNYK